jgi:elongation factor Ts
MSTISASAVNELRKRTNAPMMACKAALTEAGGDMDKAAEILRKKSKDIQISKGEREAAEGRIATFIDPAQLIGAIVEMRCESAPVAKCEPFQQLSNDVARQIALKAPATVEALLAEPFVGDAKKTVNERIGDVVGLIRENMKPARFKRLTGLLGSYVHHDGSLGVMLQVEGASADPQLLRDVCMHITARNPMSLGRDDVPAALLEKEKEIAQAQLAADPKNAKKPANILQMIVEGKLKAWYAENVLLEQPFFKDETKTVGDVLKAAGVKAVQFVRYKVGGLS